MWGDQKLPTTRGGRKFGSKAGNVLGGFFYDIGKLGDPCALNYYRFGPMVPVLPLAHQLRGLDGHHDGG